MRIITSEVKGGKIEVPGGLEEGQSVAILAPDTGQPIELTAAERQELTAALLEIRRGECVDGDELLAELRATATA